MEKLIGTGAEAVLIQEGNKLIKKRIKKSYRIKELDEKLRKQRTKKELKLLEKASKLIQVPKLIKGGCQQRTDRCPTNEIDMEFIQGLKLSDNLDNLKNAEEVCRKIGANIAKLHDADIIHGDLTTSNMIYVPDKNVSKNKTEHPLKKIDVNNNQEAKARNERAGGANEAAIDKEHELSASEASGKVYFIDFGLGFESKKIEDKAVDLHLIKQALEAKHFKNYERFFKSILEGYKLSKHYEATINRLNAVEKRGRYKQSY